MLKTTHFIAFLPSSSANLSVISVISRKSRDAACCVKITHPSSISLFVFICISMSWYALHLHPVEGDGEQTGGQARSALKV